MKTPIPHVLHRFVTLTTVVVPFVTLHRYCSHNQVEAYFVGCSLSLGGSCSHPASGPSVPSYFVVVVGTVVVGEKA